MRNMATLKPKANPMAGKLKHVRIEMANNGGATVHTLHHGQKEGDYPSEKPVGAYGSKEEALHEAAKQMGANTSMSDDDADDVKRV